MNSNAKSTHSNPSYTCEDHKEKGVREEDHKEGGQDTGHKEGGCQDTKSAASSCSSRSSMQFFKTNLKTSARTRWVLIMLAVAIAVIVVVAIVVAVSMAARETEGVRLSMVHSESQHDSDHSTTSATPTVPSTLPVNASIPTETTPVSATSPPTTAEPTSAIVTTSTLPPVTTPFVDLSTPTNSTVVLSDVFYNPTVVKSVTLKCQGRHRGDWTSLTIRRQFKDGYEPVAVATASTSKDAATVIMFYPNVKHKLVEKKYEITLIVTIDPFTCDQLTNFSCALVTAEDTVAADANITVFMPQPTIIVPHAKIENREITLECKAEIWGNNGSIVWKMRPQNSPNFLTFDATPTVTVAGEFCSRFVNSSLTFNLTMYENGSTFRCEIVDSDTEWNIEQGVTSQEEEILVLPGNFCEGKAPFTIHPHPHYPCSLVVYCMSTEPTVFEIPCDPGSCYDTKRTACVPM